MRFILSPALILLAATGEPYYHQLDLIPLLHDASALQKLRILYQPPSRDAYEEFYIYGDGSLVWQAWPKRMMLAAYVPTCRSSIRPDEVKEVVRLMIQKHFFKLPEKQFIFITIAQGQELAVHTIGIDNGTGIATRSFATGEYRGKEESIPRDFAAIEERLEQLKDTAFPPHGKTCHLAPRIKFWSSR